MSDDERIGSLPGVTYLLLALVAPLGDRDRLSDPDRFPAWSEAAPSHWSERHV